MNSNKVSVLTYDKPHRKTYDTLALLKSKGYENVEVYAIPFHYVKKFQPLIQHRPGVVNSVSPKELCKNFNYKFTRQDNLNEVNASGERILICGSGIIPKKLIDQNTIINSHPAILPLVRGLDALKWSLRNGQPLGVTSHVISEEADAGFLIEQKEIEITEFDSFHSLAYRLYELEIKMLVDALEYSLDNLEELNVLPGSKVHKRMSNDMERELFNNIELYLKKYLLLR